MRYTFLRMILSCTSSESSACKRILKIQGRKTRAHDEFGDIAITDGIFPLVDADVLKNVDVGVVAGCRCTFKQGSVNQDQSIHETHVNHCVAVTKTRGSGLSSQRSSYAA